MIINYISQLKALLAKGGVSQTKLASRLGVTFAALNRWVNGHAVPHPNKIMAIEKLYKETIGYPSVARHEINQAIKTANKTRIKKLWEIVVRNESLQNELVLEHTYHSDAIEGSTLNKKETEAVIFDKSIIPDKPLIQHLEATNHSTLLGDILQKKYKGPITEELIKRFHKVLMQGIREDAGEYSKHDRVIRGANIALTHPKDIFEEMRNLIKDWERRSLKKSYLEKMADFHVRFELIHPFGDGNGRIGRLLMVLQCLDRDYPPAIIENNRKAEYYEVLEYAQRKTLYPFLIFLCDEMAKTFKIVKRFI